MNPLVSIVVPVYNVSKYLDACVESLVNQTLHDIEIILVDDGSTDSSGDLCDEWSRKDDRVVVVHKPNGGLSDARNVGIEIAKAPYIGFVDSDDSVDIDMYEHLYRHAVSENADIAVCGVYICFADKTIVQDPGKPMVLTGVEALKEMFAGDRIRIWVPVKLYSRRVLGDAPFPVGKTYEDAYSVAEIFLRASRVAIDLHPRYHYWRREGTISTNPFSAKSLDIIEAFQNSYDVIMAADSQLKPEAQYRLLWAYFEVLDKYINSGRPQEFASVEAQVIAYLRSHGMDVIRNPYFRKSRKIAMIALMLNKRFYYCLSKIKNRREILNGE